jgi:hypothetical protein
MQSPVLYTTDAVGAADQHCDEVRIELLRASVTEEIFA